MGVAGSGKTRIGTQLAQDLGWRFIDADDFHPPENIARMAAGIPLTDADRETWLATLKTLLASIDSRGDDCVLACSALRSDFRERLSADLRDVRFVYLHGDIALCSERLRSRAGHFFRAELLQSQFDALEEPRDALLVDASEEPDAIVATIKSAFVT